MPERRRKVKLIYVIIVLVLYAVVMIALGMMKTAMVIANGIVFYRSIRSVVQFVGGVICVAVIAAFIWDLFQQMKWKKQTEKAQAKERADAEEKSARERQSSQPLSVSRNMDSVKLREILDTYSCGQWRNLSGEMRQIHIQLDMMDEQQEKLAHLLRNNGAEGLANTEEILDKVEQHMCKSVRKVINYMDVASPSNSDEVKKVLEKLYACHADNQTQLQQVQEFLFALADFLNTQGDDDNSTQMLDLYKNTILDSIED